MTETTETKTPQSHSNQADGTKAPQDQNDQAEHAFNRNYVGPKETFGFVLFSAGANVRIDSNNDEFMDRTLSIDRNMRWRLDPFIAIWDGINDLLTASFIDKTRTRFGKFRPYLVLFPIYGIPISAMFFFLPYIFWGTDSMFAPKIATWFIMRLFQDLTDTIKEIARTGMQANLTPNPEERLMLITKAAFFGMFGEDFPQQLFNILRDVISRSQTATPAQIELNMRSLFFWFGLITLCVAGLFSLYFAKVSRERVSDTGEWREKTPSVRESIQAVRRNRPLLMLMLNDILEGFTVRQQMGLYTRAVLNFANFGTISGIPGSPMSFLSYSYVPALRRRFASRTLWIVQSTINSPLRIGLFLLGMMRVGNPALVERGITRNFHRLGLMLVAFGVQNTIDMATFGIRRVIPDELRNEAIDYGEWKNGFRSEGMTGALRGMPRKFTNVVGESLTSFVIARIGFQHGENFTNQTYETEVGIFALATIIPAFMSLVSLAPKILYNISQKDREQMYAALGERRARAETLKEIEGEG